MSRGNNLLTIPDQDGLFTTEKNGRSTEELSNTAVDDEDDDEEDVHLIPRSSPVPRKRGHSITDETAEYMRIQSALPLARRVSFADTTGGDLVDVKEFVEFDSDDEDSSRWEAEEARYRPRRSEPIYSVHPEFEPLTGTAFTLALHTNKVEVESVSPVPDEPLAFSGLIRVLNISFHKSVYVRSTMDGWINHFDYVADYVEGSNDGETDQFSFQLSFAPPYLFQGARIDFVVRYETSDGDHWANNSRRNYIVSLNQTYEDDKAQASSDRELKGILKPFRYRMVDYGDDDALDLEIESMTSRETEPLQPGLARPAVLPELDLELSEEKPSSAATPNTDLLTSDCTQFSAAPPVSEQPLHKSTATTSETDQQATASQASQQPRPPVPQLESPQQPTHKRNAWPQEEVQDAVSLPFYATAQLDANTSLVADDLEDSFKPNPPVQADNCDSQPVTAAKVSSQLDLPEPSALPVTLVLERDETMASEEEEEDEEGVESERDGGGEVALKSRKTKKVEEEENLKSLQALAGTPSSSCPSDEVKTDGASGVEEDLRPQEEDLRPREEDLRPREGDLRPREGDLRPREGDLRPREGDLRPREGDLRPTEEDLRPQEEDLRPREGDLRPTEEDLRPQEEDLRPREEDLRPREGNLRPREEDLRPREEDLRPREEDLRPREGDLRPREGDLRPREGDLRPREGDLRPREGDLWPREGEQSHSEDSQGSQGEVGTLPAKDDSAITGEGTREAEAGLRMESFQAGGEEVPGAVASCLWHPPVVVHLGPTGEDRVTQSLPSLLAEPTLDPSTPHQHLRRGVVPELSQLVAEVSEDRGSTKQQDAPAVSGCQVLKEESLVSPATSSDLTTNTTAMPPAGPEGACIPKDDLVACEEWEFSHDFLEPTCIPPQTLEVPENKLPLPSETSETSETSEVPMTQSEPSLDRTLIPSIVFLSVVICLVVGLREPSVFLFVGLFLVSLCC